MAHFIANGTNLYKYRKPSTYHLLRTPLAVELTADDMSYYVVAGYYTTQNLPDRGFIEQSTSTNVIAMGYQALQNYNNPTDARQIWRTTSVQVASAWYQGAYATSAPTMSGAFASCECCIWLQAVHFTVPRGGTITSASITATNVGCITCNGSAGQGSAQNAIWHPSNGWGWQLAGRSALGTPSQML